MNNFERRNIKLLNLVDAGLSGRTLLRIIDNCYDHYVRQRKEQEFQNMKE